MTNETYLPWMTDGAIDILETSIKENLDRYIEGDFTDLMGSDSWQLQQLDMCPLDKTQFEKLSGSSTDDWKNSAEIFISLKDLPPRIACQRNTWIHLSHGQMLGYFRDRWLPKKGDSKDLIKVIREHIFKGGQGCRDDNAVGRLWWTGHIASQIAGSTERTEVERVLKILARTTETRMQTIERPGIFMERGLARHIINYLDEGKLVNHKDEKTFREFMKSINFNSNGRWLGDLSKAEAFSFLDNCR